jgi:glutathione S-transferase
MSASYQVVYHAALAFRAAPIQMLLLDAKIDFTMVEPTWGEDRVIENNAGNHTVFAPPVIRRGDFTLSQTSAIMHYLGERHGYSPSGGPEASATCLQVILDAGDVGAELFACAKDKEAKAKFASTESGGRLGNWLAHLNKIYSKSKAAGNAFLFGSVPTSADFMLLSTLESLDFAIGAPQVAELCPEGLTAWRVSMEARPFFEAYKAHAKPNLFPSMKAEA